MLSEVSDATSQVITDGSVDRKRLYDLVWSKPMVEVAKRFQISSSYMARVCAVLNVPWPPRGYWAKLAVGKASPKPELPRTRPGEEDSWTPGAALPQMPKYSRNINVSSSLKSGSGKPVAREQGLLHRLLRGTKPIFEVGRFSSYTGHLRPNKYLLPDLVVSKDALGRALTLASALYCALEEQGCPVVLAPRKEYFRRGEVDVHEKKKKYPGYGRLWSPSRPTVTYVGAVAIGITLFELCEEAEARYENGQYVRLTDAPAKRTRRSPTYGDWTTTRDFMTGHFCIQAYSPYGRTSWVLQWRDTADEKLSDQIPAIVKALKRGAPDIGRQAVEAQRLAEIEHQRRQEQHEQWKRESEASRVAKTIADSRDELKKIIALWGESKQVEEFFKDAEHRLVNMAGAEHDRMKQRLERARQLMGSVDALKRLDGWRIPEER